MHICIHLNLNLGNNMDAQVIFYNIHRKRITISDQFSFVFCGKMMFPTSYISNYIYLLYCIDHTSYFKGMHVHKNIKFKRYIHLLTQS